MTARRWTIGVLLGLVVAALPSPTRAAEADEPVVTATDASITYVDPTLADEDTTQVRGTLRAAVLDGPRDAQHLYAIQTRAGDRVPVDLAADLPAEAVNGAVAAEVVGLGGDDPSLASAVVTPVAASALRSTADHRAYVVRAAASSADLAKLPSAAVVTSTLQAQVLDEWATEADGAISSFTVAGAYSLISRQSRASLCSFADIDGLWDEAAATLPASWDQGSTVAHLVVVFPGNAVCGAYDQNPLGVGTVGAGINDLNDGASTLRWDDGTIAHTGVHELGHNVGLDHANAPGQEYGDLFSVMGFGIDGGLPPALDSAYRDWLGVTGAGEVATVTSGTETFTLQDRGDGSGLRGVRVTDPVTRKTYWVEYREGAGRDEGSAYRDFTIATGGGQRLAFSPGVVITETAASFTTDRQVLLVPRESGTTDRGSWTAGQSYTTPSAAVGIRVVEVSGGTATVAVTAGKTFATTVPTIAGAPRVGATLTAQATPWTPAAEFTYQWFAGSTAIAGATRPTYAVAAADRGKTLRVQVTGTRAGYTKASVSSAVTARIGDGTFAAATPKISGTVKVGRTLSVSRGTWTPSASTYRYQWYAGSKAISGATKSTYKVTKSQVGKTLKVRVTGTRSGYASLSKTSASTKKVAK